MSARPLASALGLPEPYFPQQDDRGVAEAAPLVLAVGDRALAHLRDVVLDIDIVRPVHDLGIEQVELVGEDVGRDLVRGRRFSASAHLLLPQRREIGGIDRRPGMEIDLQRLVRFIVDRHAPRDRDRPLLDARIGRGQPGRIDVRHHDVLRTDLVRAALAEMTEPVFGLFRGDGGHVEIERIEGLHMGEGKMRRIARVLDVLIIVAEPRIGRGIEQPFILEFRKARPRRRFALAEINEDKADIFRSGIGPDLHLAREILVLFRRLIDAIPIAVRSPAVIEAADAVVDHDAHRKLRAAMRAAMRHGKRPAALPAIERELLAQDLERLRLADRDFVRHRDGVPEPPQILARQGSGARPCRGLDVEIDRPRASFIHRRPPFALYHGRADRANACTFARFVAA